MPSPSQTTSLPEVEPRTTIADRAAAAKKSGISDVTFATAGVTYPIEPTGLRHAIVDFTVIVGVPVAKQTVVQNGTDISTWYTIDTKEVIADRPCKMCALLSADNIPSTLRPTTLLPIPPHSILLSRRGGSTKVDGVTVTETENGISALTIGTQYLFVVDKSPNGMARLVLNDAGIYTLAPEGQALTPLAVAAGTASVGTKAGAFPSLAQLRQSAQAGK